MPDNPIGLFVALAILALVTFGHVYGVMPMKRSGKERRCDHVFEEYRELAAACGERVVCVKCDYKPTSHAFFQIRNKFDRRKHGRI